MPKAVLYNVQGDRIGDVDLQEEIFGKEVNPGLLHQAVIAQLANRRRGTASTKKRGEVRGSTRKPWRQKGTGRARVGSIRSPLWRGGGITFGPKPRDYSFRLNKKTKVLALKSALSAKAQTGDLLVVDDISLTEGKTKEILKVLDALDIKDTQCLIVTEEPDALIKRAVRNLPGVFSIETAILNVHDVLDYKKLLFTKAALAKAEEVLTDA